MIKVQIEDKEVLMDSDFYESVFIKHNTWKINKGRYPYPYRRERINGKETKFYMHRLVASAPKGMVVDHINGNVLDNRVSNLRICKQGQNICNQKRSKGISKYKGVSKQRINNLEYWVADCGLNGKTHRKYCKTEIEAAKAYNELAKELHGEFALLNEIEGD